MVLRICAWTLTGSVASDLSASRVNRIRCGLGLELMAGIMQTHGVLCTSKAELALDLVPGNPLGVGEGLLGGRDIRGILKSLEQLEVLDGYHGDNILAIALHHHPLPIDADA